MIRLFAVAAPLVSVLGWGEVPEAGLVALAVVEDLDELEQVDVGFGSGVEPDRPRIPAISTLSRAQNVSIASLS